MMYTEFNVGEKTYKLRLNTRTIINLERTLGHNPLLVFIDEKGNEKNVSIESMVSVLHAALQNYQPEITLDNTYDIFDEWLANGHITSEFVSVMIELYRESGLFRKTSEKN